MWVDQADRMGAEKQAPENGSKDRMGKGRRPKKKGREVPRDTVRCIKTRNEKHTFGFAT